MKSLLKWSLLGLLLLLLIAIIIAAIPRVSPQPSEFGQEWAQDQGLDPDSLAAVRQYITNQAREAESFVALRGNRLVFAIGDQDRLINCHSVRKAIMSLLIGIAIDQGKISLNETLADLGIDESRTPLTHQEKTATVRDLLMSRSGVYLPAEAETEYAAANRPQREQYLPGAFYFYNNFDFNVLGTILEQKTGQSIGEFLYEYVAKPTRMQDFHPSHVVYGNPMFWREDQSDHRVYWIYMSARDLARIGAVMVQQGRWQGQQIVSAAWVEESTQAYSELHESMWPMDGYGYLWARDQSNGTIWADGYGGQFMLLDPARRLVLVQRNFTGNSLLSQAWYQMAPNQGNRADMMEVYYAFLRMLNMPAKTN